MLQQRDKIPPDDVGADGDEAKDLAVGAGLIDEVKGLCPRDVSEKLLGQRDDHGLVILKELDVDVQLLLFLLVHQLVCLPVRLQNPAVRVRRSGPIVH